MIPSLVFFSIRCNARLISCVLVQQFLRDEYVHNSHKCTEINSIQQHSILVTWNAITHLKELFYFIQLFTSEYFPIYHITCIDNFHYDAQKSVPQILQIYIIYTIVQQFSNQNLPQLRLKLKTRSVDMLLTTHHSCMQNRPCKEDYHQFIV